MKQIFSIALLFLMLSVSGNAQSLDWPVKRKIDLASGFGDMRANRFHSGVDIRTGGAVGEAVFSPVAGYVWRVRTSYEGYGKVIYIMGNDGCYYVFAHLAKFIPSIDNYVKTAQLSSKRYFVDLYPPAESLKIRKGQLIAQSGQTGAGAPHLHFEKRSPDNQPINPLTHGFSLSDNVRPMFTRVGFKIIDDTSMFESGVRKMFYDVRKTESAGRYVLDTVLYFNRPFGIMADCFDLMRPSGMKRTVRKLSLYVDDQLYYESIFDTLNYESEQSVNFEYDYGESVEDRPKVRRLFEDKWNQYRGSKSANGSRGYIGRKGTDNIGVRSAKVVAEDCCGNVSELDFKFIYGRAENIFHLDSTITTDSGSTLFYFKPIREFKLFGIDSVIAFKASKNSWNASTRVKSEYSDDGSLICRTDSRIHPGLVLRLFIFTKSGGLIRDNLFHGIMDKISKSARKIEATVDDEGLWVDIFSTNKGASKAWVKLYHDSTLLGTWPARMLTIKNYRCFIAPSPELATITKIEVILNASPDYKGTTVKSFRAYAVGYGRRTIKAGDKFEVSFEENSLYNPLFIQIKTNIIFRKSVLRLNSDYYEILPEAFICREEFEVSIEMIGEFPKNDLSGICWLDKKENKWVWLENERDGDSNRLRTKSLGGGSFAVVIDYDPPSIKNLNVKANKKYRNAGMPIRFELSDTLSGFEDDRNILIKLDGDWMIPEYDPETFICQTAPIKSLEPGEHHLAIVVTDRVGNKVEKYLKFWIRAKSQKRR